MKNSIWLGSALGGLLVAAVVLAGDLKSGPQPGDKVSPFHPLNVTGSKAGEKACLV